MARIEINKKVLSENDRLATELRRTFEKHNLLVLNIVSSPGSGKTSLLEQTIKKVGLRMALIVGDIQTENDAIRLQTAGAKIVRPIETGGACHLDASMIIRAISDIDLTNLDLLIIENVGNLVCPSSYDLGEDMKVVLISTTEVEGVSTSVLTFLERLPDEAPALSRIDSLDNDDIELCHDDAIVIQASTSPEKATTGIPPDNAVCSECIAEMNDPTDRR